MANTDHVPEELIRAMARKELFKMCFSRGEEPDYIGLFRAVECNGDEDTNDAENSHPRKNFIWNRNEISKGQLDNYMNMVKSQTFFETDDTRDIDHEYPRSKFLLKLLSLDKWPDWIAYWTRQDENKTWYHDDIYPSCTVLTASYKGRIKVTVEGRVWWSWSQLDTDYIYTGEDGITRAWVDHVFDFDIKCKVEWVYGDDGYHTGGIGQEW